MASSFPAYTPSGASGCFSVLSGPARGSNGPFPCAYSPYDVALSPSESVLSPAGPYLTPFSSPPCAYSPVPTPHSTPFYTVPSEAFEACSQTINGYHQQSLSMAHRHGHSTASGPGLCNSPASPSSPSLVPSLTSSFSFSSRHFRNSATTNTTTAPYSHDGSRLSLGPRKGGAGLAYGLNRGAPPPSLKVDSLLDRKAFISLEKSINWQLLMPSETLGSTAVSPLSSTVTTSRSSLFSCSSSAIPSSSPSAAFPSEGLVDSPKVPNLTPGVTEQLCPSSSSAPSPVTHFEVLHTESRQAKGDGREFSLPGMKDVPAWLKLLRLHKYAPFFARMPYEEMLSLTEDVLEHRNITKGARQKLILSIQKLKARAAVLLSSESQLLDSGRQSYRWRHVSFTGLSTVLFQIRAFLSTPIRPLSRERLRLRPHDAALSLTCSSSPSSSSFSSCTSSVNCSSCSQSPSPPSLSLSSSSSGSPSSPPSAASFLSLVDFNNNNNSTGNGQCTQAPLGPIGGAFDRAELLRLWASLSNEDLPDIMSRVIGHVHHILVDKCRRRLKRLQLWQPDCFSDTHDKLSLLSAHVSLHVQEREEGRYDKGSLPLPNGARRPEGEQVNGNIAGESEDDEEEEEEEEEEEDSGCLLDLEPSVSQEMASSPMGASSSSSSSTPDKDSGVDEDLLAQGESSDNSSQESDVLSCEEEEELYLVLRTVLDKCLSHEAFTSQSLLFHHWRAQLQVMLSSLRYTLTTPPEHHLASSFAGGAKAGHHHHHLGDYVSPMSGSVQCHSPVSSSRSSKVAPSSFTANAASSSPYPSYKKSGGLSSFLPKTSPGYSSSTTLTRSRLLPSRASSLRSSANHSSLNGASAHASLSRNALPPPPTPEEVAAYTRAFDRRVPNGPNPNPVSIQQQHQQQLYTNLSVIPRMSTLLSSSSSSGVPLSLNLNPNAVSFTTNTTTSTSSSSSSLPTTNSPETNLRNLLLQQLLTTQQQQQQQQSANQQINGSSIVKSACQGAAADPLSLQQHLLSHQPQSRTVGASEASLPMAPLTFFPLESMHTTSHSYSPLFDRSASCSSGNASGSSSSHSEEDSREDQQSSFAHLSAGTNLWSLNAESVESKKASNWNATGLLSSLEYAHPQHLPQQQNGPTSRQMEGALRQQMEMTPQVDHLSSCLGMAWSSPTNGFNGSSSSPFSSSSGGLPLVTEKETITFDDIEQLCIRMAEHALDMNG